MVSGTAGLHPALMGMYEVQPTLASGSKAVYKNSNGQYLYYWPEYTDWRIGADYKKAEAWMESTSNTNTTCPQDSSSWHEVDFDGTFAGNISVQVAAGTCAGFLFILPPRLGLPFFQFFFFSWLCSWSLTRLVLLCRHRHIHARTYTRTIAHTRARTRVRTHTGLRWGSHTRPISTRPVPKEDHECGGLHRRHQGRQRGAGPPW